MISIRQFAWTVKYWLSIISMLILQSAWKGDCLLRRIGNRLWKMSIVDNTFPTLNSLIVLWCRLCISDFCVTTRYYRWHCLIWTENNQKFCSNNTTIRIFRCLNLVRINFLTSFNFVSRGSVGIWWGFHITHVYINNWQFYGVYTFVYAF